MFSDYMGLLCRNIYVFMSTTKVESKIFGKDILKSILVINLSHRWKEKT